jgi:fatty-acyl-CoA synthase
MTNLSYVCGVGTEPLLYKTVGAVLEEAAARWGEREALIVRHQNIRWTYRELDEAADRLAAGFLHLGLVPGDRIGIWAPNRYECVVTQFASAKAGLILVTINPAYRTTELEYALNKVGCKALVLAPSFKTSDYAGMLDQVRSAVPSLRAAILMDAASRPGFLRYADVASSGTAEDLARVRELRSQLQPEDAINIQFTSGTTGLPKGATLSHHNIVNNGYFVAQRMTFSSNDRLCIPVPLYHCFGMVMGVLGCATYGAAMVFPAEAFEPKSVLEALEAERCTALFGVPTMFIAELEHSEFKRFDLRTLRTGVMAGAPCPVEVMKRVIAEMHMKEVTIAYGMTETI